MLSRATDEQSHRSLRAIEQGARDAVALLDRMRRLSDPASPGPRERVDVNELLEYAVDLALLRSAGSGGAPVEVRRNLGAVPPAMADGAALRGALANIVLNSVEAMPEGGCLGLETRREGNFIRVEVSDTGTGIPDDMIPRIFDPFVSTKSSHGRGLGLSSARNAVMAHGGDIWISSRPGAGTTVYLRLPVHGATESPEAPSTGASVLVIEDDQLPLSAVSRMLRFEGHAVSACRTLVEGLAELSKIPYSVVITGLRSPEKSGNMLRALRHACPTTKVIVLASWEQSGTQCAPEHRDADYVVSTPVFPVELRAAINEALNTPPQ